ncbi:MAG TPA: hypothetical protein PLE92_08810 [Lentisphaeria bacterium]|nr:hypothetical protein [Lentisphaeria bacterium]
MFRQIEQHVKGKSGAIFHAAVDADFLTHRRIVQGIVLLAEQLKAHRVRTRQDFTIFAILEQLENDSALVVDPFGRRSDPRAIRLQQRVRQTVSKDVALLDAVGLPDLLGCFQCHVVVFLGVEKMLSSGKCPDAVT